MAPLGGDKEENAGDTSTINRDTDEGGIGDNVGQDGSWRHVDSFGATSSFIPTASRVPDPTEFGGAGFGGAAESDRTKETTTATALTAAQVPGATF